MCCPFSSLHFLMVILHFCKVFPFYILLWHCDTHIGSFSFCGKYFDPMSKFLTDPLQRYSPRPLAFLSIRPLYPVKPFSKILGSSSLLIPIPVSRMVRRIPSSSFSAKIVTLPCLVYFSCIGNICSSTKQNHFSSVSTR